VNDWISVDERMPENNNGVLISQKTGYKDNSVIVVGRFVARHTVEIDTDGDFDDYSEEKDAYFTPEGWYEDQWNWSDYSGISIREKVTHWMPLPELPVND